MTNRESARRAAPRLCAAVIAVALAACTATQRRPEGPDDHRTIAEGYSLLYGICSQQKDLDKLLLVKVESDAVDRVVTHIADYTGDLTGRLEDMAKRYPALTVRTQFLPRVEVMARKSIADATQNKLLSSSGRVFERELLLSQRAALEQEQHIARVMATIETADERRVFWQGVDRRFGELRDEVETLLRKSYFCG